jgi:hypothetical protein
MSSLGSDARGEDVGEMWERRGGWRARENKKPLDDGESVLRKMVVKAERFMDMKAPHDGETGCVSVGVFFVRVMADKFSRHCLVGFTYANDTRCAREDGVEKSGGGNVAHPRQEERMRFGDYEITSQQ